MQVIEDWSKTKFVKCTECGKVTEFPIRLRPLQCGACGNSEFTEHTEEEIKDMEWEDRKEESTVIFI